VAAWAPAANRGFVVFFVALDKGVGVGGLVAGGRLGSGGGRPAGGLGKVDVATRSVVGDGGLGISAARRLRGS